MTARRLRVLIDGSILKPQLGGIGTYVVELAAALSRRHDVEVHLATSAAPDPALPAGVELIEVPHSLRRLDQRMIWRERYLPALISASKPDVLIAPTVELPLRRLDVPTVMVVHDVVPVEAPELYGRLRWLRFRIGLPIALRRADHVVCVSHATLTALHASFPRFGAPCTVIGEAARTLPYRDRRPREPRYILHVGAMLAHKNIRTLVNAMDRPELRGTELLLAGPIDDRTRRLLDVWRKGVDNPHRIRHLGFVSVETLADLYAEAAVVVAPSLGEGFGLPVLEAMGSGAPIVASSIAAHHEIGGDAVMYVRELRDPGAWAAAVSRLLDDSRHRNSLSRAARARAGGFSWDTVAAQMTAIARSTVTMSSGRKGGTKFG